MITPTQMYWIVTLDSINVLLFTLSLIFTFLTGLIVALGVAAFTKTHDYSWDTEERIQEINNIGRLILKAIVPASASLTLLLYIATTLIPTTKQMAAIIIVPSIANSERVQTVGNKLYDLAVEWMDELKPGNGKMKGGAK